MQDDHTFLNLAHSLARGRWLGDYNQFTLIKGPFYSMWVAMIYRLGMPLLLAQQLFYIAACLVFIFSLRPLLLKPSFLFLIWGILLFNPMSYTDHAATRAIREGIYPALTIFIVAGAIGVVTRYNRPIRAVVAWSILFGAALSAFWLTREEGIWILPFIFIIIGFTSVRIWQRKPMDWRRLFLACILPFIILMSAIGVVAGINKIHYGVFTTVEFKSKDFLSAYGALSRVKHAHFLPYVTVPKETREHIYIVSPAFAELKPFLEGAVGKAWIANSRCEGGECADIGGGWFMWALRDAASAAGYHSKDALTAAHFYHRIAREINAACKDQRLDCEAERASLITPLEGRVCAAAYRYLFNIYYLPRYFYRLRCQFERQYRIKGLSEVFS